MQGRQLLPHGVAAEAVGSDYPHPDFLAGPVLPMPLRRADRGPWEAIGAFDALSILRCLARCLFRDRVSAESGAFEASNIN